MKQIILTDDEFEQIASRVKRVLRTMQTDKFYAECGSAPVLDRIRATIAKADRSLQRVGKRRISSLTPSLR